MSLRIKPVSKFSLSNIISWSNLLHAYRRAAAGKKKRYEVLCFEYKLETNLLELERRTA